MKPFGVVNGGSCQHHANARCCLVELCHKACLLVCYPANNEDDDILRTVRVSRANREFREMFCVGSRRPPKKKKISHFN